MEDKVYDSIVCEIEETLCFNNRDDYEKNELDEILDYVWIKMITEIGIDNYKIEDDRINQYTHEAIDIIDSNRCKESRYKHGA